MILRLCLLVTLMMIALPVYAQETELNLPFKFGVAIHGEPKYTENSPHLDYVNIDAPKQGTLQLHEIGTFDSLNRFIIKGVPAAGTGLVFESLMEQSLDEPFSMYGLLAEGIRFPEDRSWVEFRLRPEARWHDGEPITAEDVKWSFETLIKDGKPFFKAYYGDVDHVEVIDEEIVRFNFKVSNNRELPLIIGQMPVFPKHYWEKEENDFTSTSLTPFLGSGPYKIGTINAGRSIEYIRNPDWWGKDLAFSKGRYNFDKIVYEYYRDSNIALEAFFGKKYDVRLENTAKLWATAYDTPAVKDGRITKTTIQNNLPQGMQGFIYNIRRPIFQDKNVRKALSYAFDFEWSNKQFAYSAYKRSRSYFSNSEMEARNLPEDEELEILNNFKGLLPEEVFTEVYMPPSSDGSGRNRRNLATAQKLLDDAGYKLGDDGIRVNSQGTRLEFEFIANNPAFERWIIPFTQNLEKIGVKASFRVIDPAQYQKRMTDFDFDMTVMSYPQSSSPGNEQREFWGTSRADMPGSRNYIGIKDAVVDALIEDIIQAQTREDLVVHTQALDRVLQHGYYLIPNWHLPAWRVAYWEDLARPDTVPDYDLAITSTWWATKP